MATNPPNRIQQIVKVAEVRKQRLANAAAAARRVLVDAQAGRERAEANLHEAATILREAGDMLLQGNANEQMLVWQKHCLTKKHESIASIASSNELCVQSQNLLSQSLVAVQRQDLRHDALAAEAAAGRRKHARMQETRNDDELQGCTKGRLF